MNIKKIGKKELFDAYLISAYCFHMRVEDPEAERGKVEADEEENWAAFDDHGTMMARIINNRFTFYLDGQEVQAGGIGGVSTLPEYRDSGAVREMFKVLLPEAYRNGEVISTLYPFKHAFYRKAGYEVVTYMNEYTMAPAVLGGYRFSGRVKKWDQQEPVSDFLDIYNAFAPRYNMAAVRTEKTMLEHLKAEKPYMDRKFSYIFGQDDKNIAYMIFTDIRHDPGAVLQVDECAWTCRDGFYAILGFLARFEADYAEIRLPLPAGIDLLRIVQSPRAYDIQKATGQSFMVRVINVKRLLEVMKKPAGCSFTVKVTDDIIVQNNATYIVSDIGVSASDSDSADLEADVRALGQMAVGAVNFDEALLRRDVTVNGNEETLRSVFTEKKIFVGEHF